MLYRIFSKWYIVSLQVCNVIVWFLPPAKITIQTVCFLMRRSRSDYLILDWALD